MDILQNWKFFHSPVVCYPLHAHKSQLLSGILRAGCKTQLLLKIKLHEHIQLDNIIKNNGNKYSKFIISYLFYCILLQAMLFRLFTSIVSVQSKCYKIVFCYKIVGSRTLLPNSVFRDFILEAWTQSRWQYYTIEISKRYKSGLDVLFCQLFLDLKKGQRKC